MRVKQNGRGSVPFYEKTSAVRLAGEWIEGGKMSERLFAGIKMTKFRGWNLYSENNSIEKKLEVYVMV